MKGKLVNLDSIIAEFQALASEIGPSFTVRDAEANSNRRSGYEQAEMV